MLTEEYAQSYFKNSYNGQQIDETLLSNTFIDICKSLNWNINSDFLRNLAHNKVNDFSVATNAMPSAAPFALQEDWESYWGTRAAEEAREQMENELKNALANGLNVLMTPNGNVVVKQRFDFYYWELTLNHEALARFAMDWSNDLKSKVIFKAENINDEKNVIWYVGNGYEWKQISLPTTQFGFPYSISYSPK